MAGWVDLPLQVHLALDARLGKLLKLTAGADASIDKVKLTSKGVKATAQPGKVISERKLPPGR